VSCFVVSPGPMGRRVARKPRQAPPSVWPPSKFAPLAAGPVCSQRSAALVAVAFAVSVVSVSMLNGSSRELASQNRASRAGRKVGNRERVPVRRGLVIAEYPHDRDAFTQGLLWHDGGFVESTGLRGRSTIRRVDLETGIPKTVRKLPDADFGEGCAIVGGELVQILWKTGKAYVYRWPEFELTGEVSFDGDGWGMTADRLHPELLYMSDGSSQIRVMRLVWDDSTASGDEKGETLRRGRLEYVRKFTVRDGPGGLPVSLLNELQVVGDDEIWANIWFSELVARIDARTGLVREWVDLRGLLLPEAIPAGHRIDVLNGIAHDAVANRTFVTGKLWPHVFEIRVSDEISADSIDHLNPFFTDPERVAYIMSLTE
jgi:glutaminyl-peptide cyclotransferase